MDFSKIMFAYLFKVLGLISSIFMFVAILTLLTFGNLNLANNGPKNNSELCGSFITLRTDSLNIIGNGNHYEYRNCDSKISVLSHYDLFSISIKKKIKIKIKKKK